MSLRCILFCSCFVLLLIEAVHGQQAATKDDIQTSVKECRIIQMTLSARARMQAGGDGSGGG